jgi:DGQHR domain-containing protein
MICSCCGYEIKDTSHPVDNGQRIVCEKCWNNPELFFPEKIKDDQRLKLLAKIANKDRNQNESINVSVIKLVQKGIEMYVGKMKVGDILGLYELDKFKEEELEGYQREQYEERTSELVKYLEKCPLAIMPALLVSLRKASFSSKDGDFGVLKITRKKGALWIIDGQHRIGGFSKIRDRFVFSKKIDPSLFSSLMEYEFPVVFIDSYAAAEETRKRQSENTTGLSPEDIERTIFFIVNKTQKGISSSLKDALLYRIKTSGIQGLSIVDNEAWRAIGAEIAITLNCREESPLRDKINISGKRDTGKPIQLNSFVTSLETLFKNKEFSDFSNEDKLQFLEAFWSSLKDLLPEAFDAKIEKNFMLLKALGIYSIHWIARDILQSTIKEGLNFKETEVLKEKLAPIRSFDWNTKTSPLSALGGMKGANRAHELLSSIINHSGTRQMPEQTLGDYLESDLGERGNS